MRALHILGELVLRSPPVTHVYNRRDHHEPLEVQECTFNFRTFQNGKATASDCEVPQSTGKQA
jgi:hypothetical protein